ncbi:hypothetical protein [Methylobacterium sp. Leaf91]|uniref:hypothetical protein n=1 Tax=Methylobacterium sp. Leaf91 TaxID=1736247 RepID=UPI000B12C2A1|nr:hypothetical protein [Methylobacterium sp. Leaf91]
MQHINIFSGRLYRFFIIGVCVVAYPGFIFSPVLAQEANSKPSNKPPVSNSNSCSDFQNLVKGSESSEATPAPDLVEKKYSRLSEATKAAEACAKSITESFRALREQGGGKSSWSGIEQALDGFIKGQQSFIDRIEGTGGLIEEAARSESVGQQRIEEAQRNYPEEVDREKDRLARLKEIVTATSEQKDALAKEIRRLQANKPRIAFSEGGKQFDMAIESLDEFNKVLEGFTKKIPKTQSGTNGM